MKNLLTICPSRGRPDMLVDMISSFKDTSLSDLIILLDLDDPCLSRYRDILSFLNIKFDVFDKTDMLSTTTEIINIAYTKYGQRYNFVSVTNDDIIYKTVDWDIKLANKGAISTGLEPNMVRKNRKAKGFPVISVIDRRIPDAVGWLQYPELRHSGGDNVWYWIGKRMGILHFDETMEFEHKNPFIFDIEKDETFHRNNTKEHIQKDYKIYMNWLKYKINDDIKKIQETLCEECPAQ